MIKENKNKQRRHYNGAGALKGESKSIFFHLFQPEKRNRVQKLNYKVLKYRKLKGERVLLFY